MSFSKSSRAALMPASPSSRFDQPDPVRAQQRPQLAQQRAEIDIDGHEFDRFDLPLDAVRQAATELASRPGIELPPLAELPSSVFSAVK